MGYLFRGMGVLIPTAATTLLVALCTQCNIWPGANMGLNLTWVVCYQTWGHNGPTTGGALCGPAKAKMSTHVFQHKSSNILLYVLHGLVVVLGLHQSDLPPGVGHVNPGGALLAGPAVVPGVHLVPDVFRLQSSKLPSECQHFWK